LNWCGSGGGCCSGGLLLLLLGKLLGKHIFEHQILFAICQQLVLQMLGWMLKLSNNILKCILFNYQIFALWIDSIAFCLKIWGQNLVLIFKNDENEDRPYFMGFAITHQGLNQF
jgi:hypothetical protein